MHRGNTGKYEVTQVGGESVRAFVPEPLPLAIPLELTHARQQLLERATLALGRLDSITLLLPDPNIFLYAYVRREAVLSSQIEGTQSSLSDLLLFELDEAPGVPLQDAQEVSNYVGALNHGMKRIGEGFPLSNCLIREMHVELLSHGRGSDKMPGEFRRSQNWIGGSCPGNAHFVPAPPHKVEDCMGQLERFFHDETQPYPTLIKAALAHVQFETIHPFLDGNGRIGRLLIAFILHNDGVLKQPLLYLSLYFKQNRAEYYRLLDQVRQEGDWEAWLDFFLSGVEATATNAVQSAQRLVKLFERDKERINNLNRVAGNTLRVFDNFCAQPIMNLNSVCDKTGIGFPAATRAMKKLEDLEIVKELTGQRRNRVYAYSAYIAILNEGAEPFAKV